jgi:hypothetical protein
MSFETRLYIQGVGIYVPHDQRNELLVLFPNQERAHERGLRDLQDQPICRHHAVVQFNSRYLEERSPSPLAEMRLSKAWTTLDVSGMWVGFSAEPALAPRLAVDGRVPGVPHLPELLHELEPADPLDPSLAPQVWPGQVSEADFLKAGLFLHAGVLSPYMEYEGLFRFHRLNEARDRRTRRGWKTRRTRNNRLDRKYASVLKLELGQVERFALRFRLFGSGETFELPLHSPWDELEIWIRHFCDLAWPDPDRELPEAGDADVDFVLNYALLQNLDVLLQKWGNNLPVPTVSPSWARGGPIGLEPRKCMGGGSGQYSFSRPL